VTGDVQLKYNSLIRQFIASVCISMVTIKEFTDQIQAEILRSFLSDNQIEAILTDEFASAWSPARTLVPIRLQVPDDQTEAAVNLMKEFEDSPIIPELDDV